jgi:Fur family ferric uptake transcriptional regulator
MTPQRRIILEKLQQMRSHPTADELYEIVRKDLPHISLGTVYRNLDVLCRTGQAHKIDTAGGQSRFEGDLQPHHHVRCKECGRLDDVFDLQWNTPAGEVKSKHGYEITGYRLEFDGVCPECRINTENRSLE